jgi:hypothetical protein
MSAVGRRPDRRDGAWRHVDCLGRGAIVRPIGGHRQREQDIMGKYFIAWLLGVPAFVLVLFWLLI